VSPLAINIIITISIWIRFSFGFCYSLFSPRLLSIKII